MLHEQEIETAVYQAIYRATRSMCVELPPDVEDAIRDRAASEEGLGRSVLCRIIENIDTARRTRLPLCQDTGMVIGFLRRGEGFPLSDRSVRRIVSEAVAAAYRDGYFRKSVVADPLNGRANTGTNLPAVIYSEDAEGDSIEISLMAKGFGSENCSKLLMRKPTESAESICEAVAEAVRAGGASPCPPVAVGVGIGGTADSAMVLSKKALLRDLAEAHPDPFYAGLETAMLTRINALGIGPGGLGGSVTALAVKIEHSPTHIAGLPVGVSICCWADRKFRIRIASNGEVVDA
jgi:fumarate hydratase subunit alpha